MDLFGGECHLLEILLHQVLCTLGGCLDEGLSVLLDFVCVLGGNLAFLLLLSSCEEIGLVLDQVDDTLEGCSVAHRDCDGNECCLELFLEVVECCAVVDSLTLHLVEEDNPWLVALVEVSPELDCLDLCAVTCINDHEG